MDSQGKTMLDVKDVTNTTYSKNSQIGTTFGLWMYFFNILKQLSTYS